MESRHRPVHGPCTVLMLTEWGLQDEAFPVPAFAAMGFSFLGEQRGAGGVLEDLPHAFVGFGRAFEVVFRADLLLDFLALVE